MKETVDFFWILIETEEIIKIILNKSYKHKLLWKKQTEYIEKNRERKDYEFEIELNKRRKKIYNSHFKIKPRITQLIINLNHIIQYDIAKKENINLKLWNFTRLKNGNPKKITKIIDAIIFFRDYLVHPEHFSENNLPSSRSPRSRPSYPDNYSNMYYMTYEQENDYIFQFAEVKILLIWDIKTYIKEVKKSYKKNKYFKHNTFWMISTIFFDFFGVIVDIHGIDEIADRAKIYWMTKEEITPYIKPHLRKFNRWKSNTHEFWKNLSSDLNKPIPKYEEELFINTIKNKVFLYPEMINLIKDLREKWIKCVILSDVYQPDEDFVKQQWRYNYFDDKILSTEIWLSKLDDMENNTSKIFEYALKKYNLKPEKALFVDDMIENCQSAQKAWIKTIQAQNPQQVIDEINNYLKMNN